MFISSHLSNLFTTGDVGDQGDKGSIGKAIDGPTGDQGYQGMWSSTYTYLPTVFFTSITYYTVCTVQK